jgi:hypothetical protein
MKGRNMESSRGSGLSAVHSLLVGAVALFAASQAGGVVPGCVPAPDGLIGWWRGENSTADETDANNGTIAGTGIVTYGAGVVGQAFVFDGTHRDRVDLGNPTALQLEDFTLEAWVKRSSPTVTAFDILGADGSVAGDGACILGYGRGGYIFALANDGSMILSRTDLDGLLSAPLATDTNWHHLAVTKSGSSAVFYMDGVPQATPAYVHPDPYTFDDATCACSAAVSLGSRGDARGGTFLGMIDEPAVFNRALSAGEIQAIYIAGSAGKCVLPPSVSLLIDVDFGGNSVGTPSAKVGLAAMGQTTNDFWNRYTRDVNGGSGYGDLANLRLANGTVTGVGLTVANAFGCWGLGSSDPMYHDYIYPSDYGNVTATVTNLPAGAYDLLPYSGDGNFEVTVGGVSCGIRQCRDYPLSNPPVWTEGVQYARFTNVQVSAGQSLTLTVRPGVSGYAVISGMQIASSTFTNNPPPACVAAPAGLVSWWRAEGNALDSVYNNNGTLLNGPAFTNAAAGQGFDFDGVDDRLIVSNSAALNFGAGQDFSIETWIRALPSATAFGVMSIVEKRRATDIIGAIGYSLYLDSGRLSCQLSPAPGDTHYNFTSPGPNLQDGVFHHVAMSVQRNSANGGRLYVDGQLVHTFDPTIAVGDLSNTEPLRIGNHPDPSLDCFFKGIIDESSIYSRALSATEIQGIYNAGGAGKCVPIPPPPCVPVSDELVSWWRAEGNGSDSADGNNGMLQDGVTCAAGNVGQAFAFDGNNSSVTVPASSSLNVGLGGGLSIETWIKPSTVALERPIVEWNSVTGGNPYPYGVHFWISVPVGYGAGPGCLYANIVDTVGSFHWLTSAGGLLNTDSFQHVAMTYDKTSGLAVLYLNGAIVAEKNLGSFTPQTSYNLYLGRRPGGVAAAYSWAGLMDEVSLYSRALDQTEIQAIYNAGSTGRCMEPPTILTQPVSQEVTIGLNATLSVLASGTPQLRYQWRFNGDDIADATGATLSFPVGEASGGSYSVRVTNAFGSVISADAVLEVNHPPVADAGATLPLVISVNNTNAPVVLDGSRSSDADGDPLQYRWFEAGAADPLATGAVAVVSLPVGSNTLTLRVSDAIATGSQTFAVEVITPEQAVERLVALVESGAPRSQPLIATLSAALAAIDRSNPTAAINQLQAFQNKVRAQVLALDPELAETFIQMAQEIINALSAGAGKAHGKITLVSREANGKTRVRGEVSPGTLYIIEVSTNLVDWEKIGVTTDNGAGAFEFEDTNSSPLSVRFYRVVSP